MEYSKATFYCVKDVQLHVVIYMVSETVLFKHTCNSVFFFFFWINYFEVPKIMSVF